MKSLMKFLGLVLAFGVTAHVLGSLALSEKKPASVPEQRGWPAYHGGYDNIHYSSLTQINRNNVKNLQVAWTLDTRDHRSASEMECNPIVVDGVIYVTSPKLNLIAADAETGKEIWRFDPNNGRRFMGSSRTRGLTYWSDGTQGRIFFAVRQYLYALDARTGKPIARYLQWRVQGDG